MEYTFLMHFKARSENGDVDEQICKFVKALDKKIVNWFVVAPSANTRVIYFEPDKNDSKIPQLVKGFDKDLREQMLGTKTKTKSASINKSKSKKINLEKERAK